MIRTRISYESIGIIRQGIYNNYDYYVKCSNEKSRQHTRIDGSYKQRDEDFKEKSQDEQSGNRYGHMEQTNGCQRGGDTG